MRQVRVFPPLIHNPPVLHQRRRPVVILFQRQLTNLSGCVFSVQIANVPGTVNTRNARKTGGGTERDAVVRQVTAVVIVDVRLLNRRDEFRAGVGVVQSQFPKPPSVIFRRAGHGKENPIRVKMQVDVANKDVRFRLVNQPALTRFEVERLD